MDSCEIDLSFPMLEYGTTETPWDLMPFLFRGGAAVRVNRVARQISEGELGSLLTERIELVSQLHEHLTADLVGGGSRFSVKNKIHALRTFFSWTDSEGIVLSLETVANIFVRWSDYLRHRHLVERSLSEASIYDLARLTATILDSILGRQSSLSKSTRVRKPRGKGKVHLSKADKQSLHNTFLFGHFLADICDSLTPEATVGPLPVCIRFRTGHVLEHWSGLPRPDKLATRLTKPLHPSEKETKRLRRLAWEEDRTLRTRQSLVNLRIQSELLIFIAQTGLNLQQAHTLRLEQFHYTSHLDGYQVRTYKNRREGEVLFEIFAGYRDWLKRYLEWRSGWFDDEADGLLFPLMRSAAAYRKRQLSSSILNALVMNLAYPWSHRGN